MMFSAFIRKHGDEFPFNITFVDIELEDQPLIYVNESFLSLTGYSSNEMLGKNCRFLQNGQANPDSRRLMREAISKSEPVCCDILNFKKNGERFYNRLVLVPIKYENGYLGLQHEIPEDRFEKFRPPENLIILDKVLNPLTVLLLSDMVSAEEYKTHFEECTKRLREFILKF